ncbi:unnamed protein product [Phaedon cochleariae]|uniref:Cytochrome P450 n=1 Tax=Phaedon cochleariae TaxID=80249 RepID=A0A9P0GQB4_PHACE|nr:unnamed protein product [Phaedon cochleariae]
MVMDHVLSVVVLIVIAAVTVFLYRRHTHLSWIPKPPCHFIFGHYGLFQDYTVILEKLKDITIKYGGMIRIHLPPMKPGILVTDPGILRSLLMSEQALSKSRFYNFLKPLLGEGLLTISGDRWKSHRRLINPSLGRISFLRNCITTFESKGDILLEKIKEESNNSHINLLPMMKMYTMDVICETAMGLSSNYQNNHNYQYMHSIETIFKIVLKRMRTLKRFDFIFKLTKDHQILTENLRINDEFFTVIMEEKSNKNAQQTEESSQLTFLDMLLQLFRQGSSITVRNIKDEVNTMILGGHDTTSIGLSFTLYALAHHPDIQEKVHQEQIHIFGNATEPKTVSYDNLQEMKYLEMVIKEALRLYPPIPVIARELTGDIILDGGSVLPKNLNVGIFIYGCHRDPKYFPNPEVFDPNRFMSDDILPFTHLPFSGGPRNCIGQKFAILQMKSCISKIVRNFHLIAPESEDELVLVPDVTLKPKNGLKITVRRRHTQHHQ